MDDYSPAYVQKQFGHDSITMTAVFMATGFRGKARKTWKKRCGAQIELSTADYRWYVRSRLFDDSRCHRHEAHELRKPRGIIGLPGFTRALTRAVQPKIPTFANYFNNKCRSGDCFEVCNINNLGKTKSTKWGLKMGKTHPICTYKQEFAASNFMV